MYCYKWSSLKVVELFILNDRACPWTSYYIYFFFSLEMLTNDNCTRNWTQVAWLTRWYLSNAQQHWYYIKQFDHRILHVCYYKIILWNCYLTRCRDTNMHSQHIPWYFIMLMYRKHVWHKRWWLWQNVNSLATYNTAIHLLCECYMYLFKVRHKSAHCRQQYIIYIYCVVYQPIPFQKKIFKKNNSFSKIYTYYITIFFFPNKAILCDQNASPTNKWTTLLPFSMKNKSQTHQGRLDRRAV